MESVTHRTEGMLEEQRQREKETLRSRQVSIERRTLEGREKA